MLTSAWRHLKAAFPSLVQVVGAGCFSAGAYLAWGLAPSLGVAGAALVIFGVAAERSG